MLCGMLFVTDVEDEFEMLFVASVFISINGAFLIYWFYVYTRMVIKGTRFEHMISRAIPESLLALLAFEGT